MKRHVHPLRHLLFLNFLQQDIKTFANLTTDQGAFGSGPFPCLNKAVSHYKQFVIRDVDVTRDYKTKKLIGTFTCSCGFIYARKQETHIFKIGRVKAFGEVWHQRSNELDNENLSLRAMAKELGVNTKTIKRYLIGNVELKKESNINFDEVKLAQYQRDLLKGITEFPTPSRTQLRTEFKKQYMYIYRHDKEWLHKHLPAIQQNDKPALSVDWSKRDQQFTMKIKLIHWQLLQEEKPIRITISKIGKRLGILANLERQIEKLPLTKQLLTEIIETTQQFQLRRCYKVIDNLLKNNEPLILWKIQRIAAIKSHHFHEIKWNVNTNLNNFYKDCCLNSVGVKYPSV